MATKTANTATKAENKKQKAEKRVNNKVSKPLGKGNPIINGLKFLSKSVYSQWKVLLSITVIFLLVTLVLTTATFLLDHINSVEHFIGEGVSGKLTFGQAYWWVFVTISTVGYGDITPITSLMRAWAILIAILGISFLALYTAVVVNGFTQEFQKRVNPDQFEDAMNNEQLEIELNKAIKEKAKLEKEVVVLEEKIEEIIEEEDGK